MKILQRIKEYGERVQLTAKGGYMMGQQDALSFKKGGKMSLSKNIQGVLGIVFWVATAPLVFNGIKGLDGSDNVSATELILLGLVGLVYVAGFIMTVAKQSGLSA